MSSNVRDFWGASIAAGKSAEAAMARLFELQFGMRVFDNTVENPKNPDLRGEVVMDIKFLRSAYPSEPTPAKLTKAEHLTLDVANIETYDESTLLVLVVDYTESGAPTKGLYFLPAGHVRRIMEAQPHRVYRRSMRGMQDKMVKVAVSVAECGTLTIPGCSPGETVDFFYSLLDTPTKKQVA